MSFQVIRVILNSPGSTLRSTVIDIEPEGLKLERLNVNSLAMALQTIADLPTELHSQILKFAFYDAQEIKGVNTILKAQTHQGGSGEPEDPTRPMKWVWKEHNPQHPLQFPYNAAGVCRLWHSILMEWPECWTRVIIDVASNPQRFLDIFLWSKDLPQIQVTVINTRPLDPLDSVDYSALERQRVAMVVEALRPHISRCRAISLKTMFFTSLPSPVIFLLEDAPDLLWLRLECDIDNGGNPHDYARTCDIGVRERLQTCAQLPKLSYLSLTGFWFMFLASHRYTSEWLRRLRYQDGRVTLSLGIRRFQFKISGEYSVGNFVKYCFDLKPVSEIDLHQLSLNVDNSSMVELGSDTLSDVFASVFTHTHAMVFQDVSPAFLQSIFSLAYISPRTLCIDNCIPPPSSLLTDADRLVIQNMPDHPSPMEELKDSDSMMSQSESTPVRMKEPYSFFHNILPTWSGLELSISSCPSFTDSTLELMLKPGGLTVSCLSITDCNNFTVRGLQQFLEKRNFDPLNDDGDVMEMINVQGNCPFPSPEEQEWFKENRIAKYTVIDWASNSPEGTDTFLTFDTQPLMYCGFPSDWEDQPTNEDYAEGESSGSDIGMDDS